MSEVGDEKLPLGKYKVSAVVFHQLKRLGQHFLNCLQNS